MTPDKVKMAVRLMKDTEVTINEICTTLGIARSTLYRYVSPKGEIRIEPSSNTQKAQQAKS